MISLLDLLFRPQTRLERIMPSTRMPGSKSGGVKPRSQRWAPSTSKTTMTVQHKVRRFPSLLLLPPSSTCLTATTSPSPGIHALDIEVAVDPEMLGKVFERPVTGRHETRSYYTPRPIVAFMCREAAEV